MSLTMEKNIIQCLWIGDKISRLEKLSINSYLKNDNEVHLYTYDNIDDLPDNTILKDANSVIPRHKIFKYKNQDSYAGFANLFRYKLLYEKGGFWSDMDIACLKKPLTEEPFIFASERAPGGSYRITNCFIYAEKESEIMEYCYHTALSKKPEELNWGDTGPKLISEAVVKFELYDHVVDPEVICPVDWWNCKQFLIKPYNELISEDTYAVHFWNEMWRRENIDKSATYDSSCCYEQIQTLYANTFSSIRCDIKLR